MDGNDGDLSATSIDLGKMERLQLRKENHLRNEKNHLRNEKSQLRAEKSLQMIEKTRIEKEIHRISVLIETSNIGIF